MNEVIEWLNNATMLQFVGGLILLAYFIRFLIEIIFPNEN